MIIFDIFSAIDDLSEKQQTVLSVIILGIIAIGVVTGIVEVVKYFMH